MAGLNRPVPSRRFARVDPLHVKLVWRVDDTDAHHLGPKAVDGSARKLRMRREHTGQLFAWRLGWIGFLAGQNEGGLDHALFGSRQTHGARCVPVVAVGIVEDRVFIADQRNVGPPQHPCLAEEGRLLPQFPALPFGEPDVEFLEMISAVVTRDTLQVQPHEMLEHAHSHLVRRIFVHRDMAGVAELHPADQIARRTDIPVAERPRHNQLANQFIVGLVEFQRVVNEAVEKIAAVGAYTAAAGAGQVCEPIRPAFEIGFRADQLVDQLVAFFGIFRRHELPHLLGIGDAPGQIEVDSAEELGVTGQSGVRNAVALHLGEDVLVDEVLAGDESRVAARFSVGHEFGQIGELLPAVWRLECRVIL